MRGCYERCAALVLSLGLVLALLLAGALAANAQSYEEALAKFAADSYNDTDAGHRRRRGQRQSAGGAGDRGAAGRPPAVQRRRQEGLHPRRRRPACSMRRPASPSPAPSPPGSSRCASTIACAAPSRRRSAASRCSRPIRPSASRRPRPSSSRRTPTCWPRSTRASTRRPTPRVKKALEEARAAILVGKPMPRRPTSWLPSRVLRDRGDQDARGVLAGVAGDQPADVQGARRRHRRHRQPARRLERGAEPLVRPLARLGAAARRHRPRHHLRRHGRHQHGARRDGDARRLHHLRRAGG